jgi:hypothetical protein
MSSEDAARLALYRLRPVAAPDDPRWDNAPGHGEVIVRAASPADARIVAAGAEDDFLESGAKPGDGTSTRFASAFRDEKLYHVEEVDGDDDDEQTALRQGRGIVKGDIARPVIKPHQL